MFVKIFIISCLVLIKGNCVSFVIKYFYFWSSDFERVFFDIIIFVDSLYIVNSNECWVVLFVDVLFIV